MLLRHFGLATALTATLALATPAHAVTEIQWWHAMTGPNNDVVVKLANDFNATQSDYKVVPTFKGQYADVLNAGIAAFRAGNAPGIMQVFEVGTATMMAAKGAIKPVSELMKEQGESFDPKSYLPAITGYYSTSKGDMLSFPFNSSSMVLWINVDALKKAEIAEPPKTWPELFADAKKLHARARPAASPRPGSPGGSSNSFPRGTTCRSAARPMGSMVSKPCSNSTTRWRRNCWRPSSICRRTRATIIPGAPTPAKDVSRRANVRCT